MHAQQIRNIYRIKLNDGKICKLKKQEKKKHGIKKKFDAEVFHLYASLPLNRSAYCLDVQLCRTIGTAAHIGRLQIQLFIRLVLLFSFNYMLDRHRLSLAQSKQHYQFGTTIYKLIWRKWNWIDWSEITLGGKNKHGFDFEMRLAVLYEPPHSCATTIFSLWIAGVCMQAVHSFIQTLVSFLFSLRLPFISVHFVHCIPMYFQLS